jgi:TP901 family phage tail tape measure protein
MADALVRLKVESQEYENKIQRAAKGIQRLEEATRKSGKTMADATQKEVEFVRSLGRMETVSTTTRGKLAELKTAFTDLSMQYQRLSNLEKSSPIGRAMSASIQQLQGRIRTLNTDLSNVNRQMAGGLGGQFAQGLSSAFASFGPAMMTMTAVMGAINGLKKVIGDTVQTNMQFEQSSAVLASVLGTTRDKVTALTTQAKKLGATTQYTAIQITELQTNLARLGFTQQEIMNSTTAVQALATATGADLGEAANLAGAALRAFGMDSGEMERVASVLAVSTTKSALSFEKLATAVPIVSPVAKQFGFTIEDVVTLLGKLSDAGFDASMAATATRNIFLNMANGSGKLAQALGRPIRSIEDLAPALVELRNKGIDLAEMLELTDKRSVAAFATFIESAETMTTLKTSITDCSDALQGMVDEQLNTLQGSVTIMKSAWEGLMLTFDDSNSTIRRAVDSLTELLTAWTNWRKRNQGGDDAISTYELGLTDEAIAEADAFINAEKASKKSAEQIIKDAQDKKTALANEEAELLKLEKSYRDWEKEYNKYKWTSDVETIINLQNQNPYLNTEYLTNPDLIYQQIAGKRDQMAVQDYIIGAVTPKKQDTDPTTDTDPDGPIKLLKAQYQQQEKEQIAALDRMAMNEEEYEAQVYQIKKTWMQKIADLYAEGTVERARADAALSQLDIQYQATQMRLANKQTKHDRKYQTITGPSGYSEEGIAATRQQIQNSMKGLQMNSGEYIIAANTLVDLNTFENLLKTATAHGLQFDPAQLEALYETIDANAFELDVDIPDSAWTSLVEEINAKLQDLGLPPIKLDVTTGNISNITDTAKKTEKAWGAAANAISAIGGALQQIEDPSAKVAGIIMQAVANIALGFATATTQAAAGGPFAWIAATVAGIANMISAVTAIKQVTSSGKFADGGIIGGNSYSGDNLTASVNSGELILNRAQQNTIASQLQGGAANIRVQGLVRGHDILLAGSNYALSTGKAGAYLPIIAG